MHDPAICDTDDYGVKFFMPFHNFESPAVPADADAYIDFRRRSIEFIVFRNHRIRQLGL
jgi:hypothetical protein